MSDENTTPSSSTNALTNPQVLTALITGLLTVIAALIGILPSIIQANQPTATPTATQTPTPTLTLTSTYTPAILATATATIDVTATATHTQEAVVIAATTSLPTDLPTSASTDAPTDAPTLAPVEPTLAPTQANPPNVLLIYDDVAFTVVNVSGGTLSLEGVRFRSDSGRFNAVGWANNDSIPNDHCVRLRDAAAGRRNPPGECKTLLSLLEASGDALFWRGATSFEVVRRGEVLATCATDTDRCAVYISQD
jgi:hypothetical protein